MHPNCLGPPPQREAALGGKIGSLAPAMDESSVLVEPERAAGCQDSRSAKRLTLRRGADKVRAPGVGRV
jgi:hypothetical protein